MARTKPLPRSERILRGREINRGIERTRKTDDVKNINIGFDGCRFSHNVLLYSGNKTNGKR